MSRITDFLEQRFPGNHTAPSHYGELLSAYECSRLAPPNLIEELTSGDDGKFWAHVWEAMLYRHLANLGFTFQSRVTKSGQRGPDFCMECNGKTIWVEAVTPSPNDIPPNYLEPPKPGEVRVCTMPHEQMLLRWTAVLKDKRDKLNSYIQKGIVGRTDCTVIAVNSCRLQYFAVDDLGISQLPFVVEAVFPIGPIGVPITPDGKQAGEPVRIPRFTIRKSNGADVETGNFLDPYFGNVSALLGCYRSDMLTDALPLSLVHNPLAHEPLPRRILGATKEYVADEDGTGYLLRQLVDISE